MTDESGVPTTDRRNLIAVIVLALVLVAAGVGYLIFARSRVQGELADREARAQQAVEEFEQANPSATREPRPTAIPNRDAQGSEVGPKPVPGEVVVINRVPGEDYGRLAIRHVDGTRTLLDRTCMRFHVANDHGVCVSQEDSLVPAFTTTLFRWADTRHVDVKSYDERAAQSRSGIARRVAHNGDRIRDRELVRGRRQRHYNHHRDDR